jgi:Predicted membrane protein
MRNRNKANIILISVFILFIITTIIKFLFNGNFTAGLFAFVAEAALVGGIADWFAVTALFKKPLGFSWHTAIIPNNRESIIEKISEMVSDELLSMDSIKNKLSGLDIAGTLLDKLKTDDNGSVLEDQVQSIVMDNLEHIDKEKISRDIDRIIKENLKKEDVSNEIRKILLKAFSDRKHSDWLKMLFDKALQIARKTSTREKIYKILREQERYNQETTGASTFFVKTLLNVAHGSKHTNLFTISQLLQQELIDTLVLIGDPGHPIFKKLLQNCEDLLDKLDNEDVLVQTLQTWKNGVLERVDMLDMLELLVSSVIETQIYRGEAASFIVEHLDRYKNDLKNDEEMRGWIDGILKEMLEKVIRNEHYLIGEIAKETLESFTNERLNRFIEEKVGEDLQWIRINGSIVGASAGLLIYLFTNLVYSPFVVPLIHVMFGIK